MTVKVALVFASVYLLPFLSSAVGIVPDVPHNVLTPVSIGLQRDLDANGLKIDSPHGMDKMGAAVPIPWEGLSNDGANKRYFIAKGSSLPHALGADLNWAPGFLTTRGLRDAEIKHDLADGNGWVVLPSSPEIKLQAAVFKVSYEGDALDGGKITVTFKTPSDDSPLTVVKPVGVAERTGIEFVNSVDSDKKIMLRFIGTCARYKNDGNWDASCPLSYPGKGSNGSKYGAFTFDTEGSEYRTFVLRFIPKEIQRVGSAADPVVYGSYAADIEITFSASAAS